MTEDIKEPIFKIGDYWEVRTEDGVLYRFTWTEEDDKRSRERRAKAKAKDALDR
jgi:hypothetical protein